MTPQFRFTIYHTTYAPTGTVVAQPLGWKDAILKLERDTTYYSLVEYFEGSFTWYGTARDLLITILNADGPGAQPRIYIEINFNGTWDELFDGLIDLSSYEDYAKAVQYYKLTAPIIRNDFWATFINRKSTPVNLAATVDLDGGSRTAVGATTVTLATQKVRQNYAASNPSIIDYGTDGSQYANIDLPGITLNEIDTKKSLGPSFAADKPIGLFVFLYGGSYQIDIEINAYMTYSGSPNLTDYVGGEYDIVISVNDGAAGALNTTLTKTNLNHGAGANYTRYTYSGSISVNANDEFRLYFNRRYTPLPTAFHLYCEALCTMTIVADTTFPSTSVQGWKIKDSAKSILGKLIGADDVVTSTFLDGCGKEYFTAKGINIRGFDLSQKPYFKSWDDWWSGYDPILNLGFGYTKVAGVDKFEIERKDAFFDNSPVINFDHVSNIVKSFGASSIIKSIEVGYQKWQAETYVGTDDPQAKRNFSTSFKSTGTPLSILSGFIAASMAWEETRRLRWNFGKDWKLDEDTLVLSLKKDGSNGPEFDDLFSSITDLLNSGYRYNIRLSATRNFYRWINFIKGCLQVPASQSILFAGGQGNDAMACTSSGMSCTDEDVTIAEDQDFSVDTNYLFKPELVKFKIPMTWLDYKTIVANRKKAIGVSQSTSGHIPYHINSLSYSPVKGFTEITALEGNH